MQGHTEVGVGMPEYAQPLADIDLHAQLFTDLTLQAGYQVLARLLFSTRELP